MIFWVKLNTCVSPYKVGYLVQLLIMCILDRNHSLDLRQNYLTSLPTFTYSKLTIETLEKGVKYIQS